jgi:hypothetical protein
VRRLVHDEICKLQLQRVLDDMVARHARALAHIDSLGVAEEMRSAAGAAAPDGEGAGAGGRGGRELVKTDDPSHLLWLSGDMGKEHIFVEFVQVRSPHPPPPPRSPFPSLQVS